MVRIVLVAALAGISLGAAQAGETMSPLEMAQKIFANADTDGNGVLSEAEHEAAGLERFGVSFADFDLNKDSSITLQEYEAIFEKHHKGMAGTSA